MSTNANPAMVIAVHNKRPFMSFLVLLCLLSTSVKFGKLNRWFVCGVKMQNLCEFLTLEPTVEIQFPRKTDSAIEINIQEFGK